MPVSRSQNETQDFCSDFRARHPPCRGKLSAVRTEDWVRERARFTVPTKDFPARGDLPDAEPPRFLSFPIGRSRSPARVGEKHSIAAELDLPGIITGRGGGAGRLLDLSP